MAERATRLGERTRLVEENNQEEELEDSEEEEVEDLEDSEVEEEEWEDWEERRYQNVDRITIICCCVIVACLVVMMCFQLKYQQMTQELDDPVFS